MEKRSADHVENTRSVKVRRIGGEEVDLRLNRDDTAEVLAQAAIPLLFPTWNSSPSSWLHSILDQLEGKETSSDSRVPEIVVENRILKPNDVIDPDISEVTLLLQQPKPPPALVEMHNKFVTSRQNTMTALGF